MTQRRYTLVVLANEKQTDHELWLQACDKRSDIIDYETVHLPRTDWFERISDRPVDCFLTKPPAFTAPFKQLYDERVWIIHSILKGFVYPSFEEIMIYENKRLLAYWLKSRRVPHPQTKIFYFKEEAEEFLNHTDMPLVAKMNIGASGSGVTILNNKRQAINYIHLTFSGKGAKKRWGPNFRLGGIIKRGSKYLRHPNEIQKKIKSYAERREDRQKDFVIFQEFIPHEHEWRCVRIGDSFFAHKKIVKRKKASGSLIKSYENPPLSLLDHVKEITDKGRFYSQSVDIFDTGDRGYLVNEMQCFFGQSDPYQMLVDGKPGRYLKKDAAWLFEEGMFNTHQCYDLRLAHVLDLLSQKKP